MKWLFAAVAATTISCAGTAAAQTVLPLNTGYDYATFALYPAAAPTSTVQDRYWIKIASYEPPAAGTTVAPGWVLNTTGAPWTPPLTCPAANPSRWIGPRTVVTSSPGTSTINPAYSIFKKCFCLLSGYQNPQLSFQVRSDDNVQVWLNNLATTLTGPVIGNWGGGPVRTGATANPAHFRTGLNCIYVLVDDFWGHMGFTLAGTMSATGLLPVAGAWNGPNNPPTFAPCTCPQPQAQPGATDPAGAVQAERAIIQGIIRVAEQRRALALSRPVPFPVGPGGSFGGLR